MGKKFLMRRVEAVSEIRNETSVDNKSDKMSSSKTSQLSASPSTISQPPMNRCGKRIDSPDELLEEQRRRRKKG